MLNRVYYKFNTILNGFYAFWSGLKQLIRNRLSAAVLITSLLILLGLSDLQISYAQGAPTAVPLVLPTQILSATPGPGGPVNVPTSITTPGSGQVVVEALDATTGANIRGTPDITSNENIIGNIKVGDFYQVVGQYTNSYGKWYEIIYIFPGGQPIPSWVYSGVVKSPSDPNALKAVPIVNPKDVPTPDAALLVQSTAAFLTGTPGAPGTATAMQGSATGISTLNPSGAASLTPGGILPTFTFPALMVEATLAPRATVSTSSGSLPPVVPIIGLFVIGLLGLVIGLLRRG